MSPGQESSRTQSCLEHLRPGSERPLRLRTRQPSAITPVTYVPIDPGHANVADAAPRNSLELARRGRERLQRLGCRAFPTDPIPTTTIRARDRRAEWDCIVIRIRF